MNQEREGGGVPSGLRVNEGDVRARTLAVCLEDLRTVRAHTDMRTQTHGLLQLYALLSLGGIVAGFAAFREELAAVADVMLLAPLLYFFIAALYLEVSYSAYLAEAYVNRSLRPIIYGLLTAEDGDDVPETLLTFEHFTSKYRRLVTSRLLGGLKAISTSLLPVAAVLGIFAWLKRSSEWEPYEIFAVAAYGVLLVVYFVVSQLVHHRMGLPSLVGSRPEQEPSDVFDSRADSEPS